MKLYVIRISRSIVPNDTIKNMPTVAQKMAW